MTAAADFAEIRRTFAASMDAARACLPADPVERARMTADRCREITGPQHTEVICWRCHAVVDIRDARPAGGRDYECAANQGDCTDRTGEAENDEFIYAARGRGDTGGI